MQSTLWTIGWEDCWVPSNDLRPLAVELHDGCQRNGSSGGCDAGQTALLAVGKVASIDQALTTSKFGDLRSLRLGLFGRRNCQITAVL